MTKNNLTTHLSWLSKENLVPPVGASTSTFTPAADSTTNSTHLASRTVDTEPVPELEPVPSQSQPAPSTDALPEFARPSIPQIPAPRPQSTRVLRSHSEEGMARLASAPSSNKPKLVSQGNQQLATPVSTTNSSSIFTAYADAHKQDGLAVILCFKCFS